MWTRKCVVCPYNYSERFERLWHAGLSTEGGTCFLSSVDEEYLVVNTDDGQIIWTSDEYKSDDLWPLEDAMKDGHNEIVSGPAAGRYRIFGLHYNHALTWAGKLGIELHLNLASDMVEIRAMGSQQILQELKFTVFSGDWAYASFSEDYSTIAVLEPYNVTVFHR